MDDDIDKAVKEVDRMEDEAAAKRAKDKDEYNEKEENNVIFCPKCKRPVTNGDYIDQLSNTMEDSVITKISCPQCGYMGLPLEMDAKEYAKLIKKG